MPCAGGCGCALVCDVCGSQGPADGCGLRAVSDKADMQGRASGASYLYACVRGEREPKSGCAGRMNEDALRQGRYFISC